MPISDPIRLRYDERPLRGFLIHLGVYVLVVLGLIAFNLVNNPTKLWSLWVLAGWGIGIAAHGGVIWMKAHPGQHHWFAEKRTCGFGGTCLCLCGGYPAAFRRGSRRITLHMVDLLGSARLGRRHMLGWRLAATGLRPSFAILGTVAERMRYPSP